MHSADVVSWAVRVTLLLAVGYAVSRLLERKSAAMAHGVLVATVATIFILPAVMMAFPSWQWTKPGWAATDVELAVLPLPASTDTQHVGSSPFRIDDVLDPEPVEQPRPDTDSAEHPQADSTAETASTASPDRPAEATTVLVSPHQAEQTATSLMPSSWRWSDLIVILWIVVNGFLAIRLIVSIVQLSRFVASCHAASGTVLQLVSDAAARLKLRRRLTTVLSPENTMPMACWLGRWVVILPTNFDAWPDDEQEATLAHELGHIARRDAWSDLLIQAAACVLWPNPLSWLTARSARRLRERACDEWALQSCNLGVTDYARSLLHIVEKCRHQPLRLASAMAGNCDLESRLRWLTSSSRLRTARPLTATLMILGIVSLGLAIATAQPIDPSQSPNENAPDDVDVRHAMEPVVLNREPSPETPNITVSGIVRDTNGNPLSGMHVVLRGKVESGAYVLGLRHNRDVLARTKTNAIGRFTFEKVGIPPRMKDSLNSLREDREGAQILIWGDDKGLVQESIQSFRDPEKEIELTPEANVSGELVDEDGLPVNNVEMGLIGFSPDTDKISRFLNGPGEVNLLRSELDFITTTDNGRFRLANVPRNVIATVACRGSLGYRAYLWIDTTEGTATNIPVGGSHNVDRDVDDAEMTKDLHRTPIRATMQRTASVKLRVVDHDGAPVAGGGVMAFDRNQKGRVIETKMSSDGTAVVVAYEPGVHDIKYVSDPLNPRPSVSQEVDIQPGESPVVELQLPQSRMLEGRVVDADTGDPVTGAYVSLRAAPDPNDKSSKRDSAMAVSDTDGTFRVLVADGRYLLSIGHPIDGFYVPQRSKRTATEIVVTPDQSPTDVVLRVARGRVVCGVVIGKDGRPQAGVPVRAKDLDRPYGQAFATADSDGRFELTGLSPYAETRIWAWAGAESADAMIDANPDHPPDKTHKANVDLQLDAGTVVTGRVTRHGKPAANVRVLLKKAPPQPPGQDWTRFAVVAEVTTGDDGRYRLGGLHKGDQYQLEIEPQDDAEVRDWHYQGAYGHTVGAVNGGILELPDARLVSGGQELKGVVVDPDGNPVSGISVSASLASGGSLSPPKDGPPPWTKTDSDGLFHLTNLPEEPISLMAYRANPAGGRIHYPAKVDVELNADNIRIVLDPALGRGIEDLDAQ